MLDLSVRGHWQCRKYDAPKRVYRSTKKGKNNMIHSTIKAPAYLTEAQKIAFEKIGKILSNVSEAEMLMAPAPGETTIWLGLNGKLSSVALNAIEEVTELGVFAIEPVSMEELEKMEGEKFTIHS